MGSFAVVIEHDVSIYRKKNNKQTRDWHVASSISLGFQSQLGYSSQVHPLIQIWWLQKNKIGWLQCQTGYVRLFHFKFKTLVEVLTIGLCMQNLYVHAATIAIL